MTSVPAELAPLDTTTLVEASAGTGKTYTITTYFVRAILERDLSPDQILVVTYTNAATAELRARTRKRIVQAIALLHGSEEHDDALRGIVAKARAELGDPEVERRLRGALGRMDQAAILTIHAFCQRLLQEHPLAFGVDFEVDVAENPGALYEAFAADFWVTELHDAPAWLLQALSQRKIGPSHLRALARVATMPGVEVIGPAPTPIDPAAIEALLDLHRAAAELWASDRDQVLTFLEDDALNKNSYRKATIESKWIPELQAFFRAPTVSAPPGFFGRLCPEQMRVKKGREAPSHPFFDACGALWSKHEQVRSMLDYAAHEVELRFLEFVRRNAKLRRDTEGVYSFDDLLSSVHDTLVVAANGRAGSEAERVAQTVRNAYPLALVDEFQDTDSMQYEIFRALYGDGSTAYVGDPKQAIYSFRGADVFSYLRAAADVGEARFTLGTNRRSDPGVVQGVNALFARQTPPFLIEGIPFRPATAHASDDSSSLRPPVDIVFLDGDLLRVSGLGAIASTVANEIALRLAAGETIGQRALSPGDIAVLCRSNRQALAITNALRERRVPVSLEGDSSVLETDLATDLRAILEAALLPGDSPAVRRALLTDIIGVTPLELSAMDDTTWTDWVLRFRRWNASWHQYGVLRFLKQVLEHTAAEQRLASRKRAHRDLTDLAHLQELLLRGEREYRQDPVALMQWFRRLFDPSSEPQTAAREDLQQRPDADSGAVRVTTIHKSKGLEYEVVYCPFTWKDASLFAFDRRAVKFHDSNGRFFIDLGSEQQAAHREQSEREALAEALRLIYVAATRAKRQCTLFWGPRNGWKQSALAYLLHGPEPDLGEEEMRAEVERFAEATDGVVGCRSPNAERAPPHSSQAPDMPLTARELTRGFDLAPRTTSFTSLTGSEEKVPGPSMPDTTSPLFGALPGGTRTGLFLHAVLERAELHQLDDERSQTLVETQLRLFGFDRTLTSSVVEDLRTTVATPLRTDGSLPTLASLPRGRQLRELEFSLAVDQPKLRELASILEQHGAPEAARDYHAHLSQVSGDRLRGLLRGYIDLFFEWGGRWYVADYKSNRLPTYDSAAVADAVTRDHYVLQGLLYSAAAHRFLRARIADYDPATHWGGALFLFLRGMEGAGTPGRGVFFDRQSPELLRAIDQWLGGSDDTE